MARNGNKWKRGDGQMARSLQGMAMREAQKAAIIRNCPAVKETGTHDYEDVGPSEYERGHGPQGRRLKCRQCPAQAIVS